MTGNVVLASVIERLATIDEKVYKHIYKDRLPENISESCFFVGQISSSQTKAMRNLFNRIYLFDIQYFNEDAGSEYLSNVSEKLYEIFDEIEIEGILKRTKELRYEMIDHVFHFFVSVELTVFKKETAELTMKEIKIEEGVKE